MKRKLIKIIALFLKGIFFPKAKYRKIICIPTQKLESDDGLKKT